MKKPTIHLHGGPWNEGGIEDSGAIRIRLGIASAWDGNRPKIGARVGEAIYEPGPRRGVAFWSHNEWDGRVIAIVEADEFRDPLLHPRPSNNRERKDGK